VRKEEGRKLRFFENGRKFGFLQMPMLGLQWLQMRVELRRKGRRREKAWGFWKKEETLGFWGCLCWNYEGCRIKVRGKKK
jgi:hypothetical protein